MQHIFAPDTEQGSGPIVQLLAALTQRACLAAHLVTQQLKLAIDGAAVRCCCSAGKQFLRCIKHSTHHKQGQLTHMHLLAFNDRLKACS
jgi:hypothetical protein